MPCCDIFDVFDEKRLLVKEYARWRVLVSNRTKTLGNCIIITAAHHERFSDVSAEEMREFATVVKELEDALRSAFGYDKINYLMLMMKDSHTHFHVIPRYREARAFAGVAWGADIAEWDPLKLPKLELPLVTLQAIRDEIKAKLSANVI